MQGTFAHCLPDRASMHQVRLERIPASLGSYTGWLQDFVDPPVPIAVVVSCSDSRAPAELIFDQVQSRLPPCRQHQAALTCC